MNLDSRWGKARRSRTNLPRWHYWLYWTGLLFAFAAALTAFGVIKWPDARAKQNSIGRTPIASAGHKSSTSSDSAEFQPRRLYPYSVIPGGVESPQELRNAIAHDPLVAQLYANFDLSHAHVVQLNRDREVYVSYRYGGEIYWTKKRLLLRAGEAVITDGNETGRTRCGNRVSETPMQPVRPDEPSNAAVNAPVTELAEDTGLLPSLPMESPSLDPVGGVPWIPQSPSPTVIPPPFFPLVGGGGPPSFPNVIPPPVATPEPSGLLLLALGLIALGVMAGFTNRKSAKPNVRLR